MILWNSAGLLSIVSRVYQALQFWPYNPGKFMITLLNVCFGRSSKFKLDPLPTKSHFTLLSHAHKIKQCLFPILPTIVIILTLVINSVYSCYSLCTHLKCKCTNLKKTYCLIIWGVMAKQRTCNNKNGNMYCSLCVPLHFQVTINSVDNNKVKLNE